MLSHTEGSRLFFPSHAASAFSTTTSHFPTVGGVGGRGGVVGGGGGGTQTLYDLWDWGHNGTTAVASSPSPAGGPNDSTAAEVLWGVTTAAGRKGAVTAVGVAGGTAGAAGGAAGVGVEEETFNWAILVLAPLVVFGIGGNALVILAVSLERRLQNVTNYFLLSLAVTDLLVSLIVMPFSIINEFTGRWLFGLILCNLYVTADVLMCTSSILHLCTISLERYVGIRYPLWAKNKSKRTVFFKIVLVWTLALAITSPITVLGVVNDSNILNDGVCLLTNQHFIIYGSIFAFFIPLTIMVLMYALTVRMLNKQAKLCGGSGGSGGRSAARYQPLSKRNTLPLCHERESSFSSSTTTTPAAAAAPSTRESSATDFEFCNGDGDSNENVCDELLDHGAGSFRNSKWRRFNRKGSSPRQSSSSQQEVEGGGVGGGEPRRLKELVRKHHVALKAANILLMRKDVLRKDTNAVQTEQRASKVLGVVFMIFVVCWAPFFLVNILTVLCADCYFSPTLFTVFVWLGYVSSTLNPIIYTVFNKVFKLTFLKLLCCRYGLLHRGRRRSQLAASSSVPAGFGFGFGSSRGGISSAGTSSSHSGLLTCSSFCRNGGGSSDVHLEESIC
ncbi:5-hydroxytryptamine receptor 2A-like [Babylonia areolata]|uniref:5-hydroxytryptamine receptor 2A-like n=1 Tax=Babylonia areolata TaxID=304850 RepID=UPI003FD09767